MNLDQKRTRIQAAATQLYDAQHHLLAGVQDAYPIGSKWLVSINERKPIHAEVTGHGRSWSTPGETRLVNLKTRKQRTAGFGEMSKAQEYHEGEPTR